jgi:hypothetical protein
MERKRSGMPVWVILLIVGLGVGALVVAGAVAFALVRWTAHPAGPASTTPTTLARPGFTLDYPSNWTVDRADEDYDPDHMFSIDPSDGAMIMFVIADAELDVGKVLESNATSQRERMPRAQRTDFDRWGKYTGRGFTLHGKAAGLVWSTARVFVFRAGGKTITITEFTPDDEAAQHAPGFRMIEDSFRVVE